MRTSIYGKNAERWEEKSLCSWSCLSWCDSGSSAPPSRLRHHHLPRQVPVPAGTQQTWAHCGCMFPHKKHRNVLGAWLFPKSDNYASNRIWNTLPDSTAAPGTWLKGKTSPWKQGRALCQTIHATNLQTAFSNTCGNKEELIPDYKLILQVAQSN